MELKAQQALCWTWSGVNFSSLQIIPSFGRWPSIIRKYFEVRLPALTMSHAEGRWAAGPRASGALQRRYTLLNEADAV